MSETDWIDRYIRPLARSEGADGLYDDVARLDMAGVQIATMDTLVAGVHFLTTDPLDTVGQKLVRVNVSDIYAKGARPHEALLSVAFPKSATEAEFSALMAGVGADLQSFGITLLGGDLVKTSGPLVLSLTLTGVCFGTGPVRRLGGAEPGDEIFVSGQVGWGALGLEAARTNELGGVANRYRVPELPPVEASQTVAELARASMDVSDGLLIDLKRLAEVNGRGAEIEIERIPFARPDQDIGALLAQMTGGDDYQILMVTPPDAGVPEELFTRIGRVTAVPGLSVLKAGKPINLPETLGFEH